MPPSGKSPYLSSPSALQRVMTLIGHLAFHVNQNEVSSEKTGRELSILNADHISATATWLKVAESHSEFFVVYPGEKETFLRLKERQNQQDTSRPRLTNESVAVLQDKAVKLHNEALSQSGHHLERTKMWVSALTALAGAVMGSLVTYSLTGK